MFGRLSKESSTRSNNTKAEQKWVLMRPIVPAQGTGPARHLGGAGGPISPLEALSAHRQPLDPAVCAEAHHEPSNDPTFPTHPPPW